MKQSDLTYMQLGRYVAGELTASEAEVLNGALANSQESRTRLIRVRTAVNHISDMSDAEDVDLLPGIRRRIALMPQQSAPQRSVVFRRIIPVLAAAGLLLAAAFLYNAYLKNEAATVPEGIRAKTATAGADTRTRWIALNAFRLSQNDAPTRITDTLHPDDGLVFSYTNLGPAPFAHLMVFAIDDAAQVYWYYPAFLDAKDNPRGIQIKNGVSREGLAEVIAHPYNEGTLQLFGLFSDTALQVSDIENAVHQGISTAEGFEKRFSGVRVKTLKVTVTK
ncbi:MAG: hypothetical protein JXX14_10350 [Deltaproteobacteria bacterium]|nr:hypothetical protein [Deltaproteobacteria bacterium]